MKLEKKKNCSRVSSVLWSKSKQHLVTSHTFVIKKKRRSHSENKKISCDNFLFSLSWEYSMLILYSLISACIFSSLLSHISFDPEEENLFNSKRSTFRYWSSPLFQWPYVWFTSNIVRRHLMLVTLRGLRVWCVTIK